MKIFLSFLLFFTPRNLALARDVKAEELRACLDIEEREVDWKKEEVNRRGAEKIERNTIKVDLDTNGLHCIPVCS